MTREIELPDAETGGEVAYDSERVTEHIWERIGEINAANGSAHRQVWASRSWSGEDDITTEEVIGWFETAVDELAEMIRTDFGEVSDLRWSFSDAWDERAMADILTVHVTFEVKSTSE